MRTNRKGFTYLEVISGMTILVMVFSAFLLMYRYIGVQKTVTREISNMTAVAQNMTEIYKAYYSTTVGTSAEAEAKAFDKINADALKEGYKLVLVQPVTEGLNASNPDNYIYFHNDNGVDVSTVTIAVYTTYSFRNGARHIEPYVLNFYVTKKSS